LIKRTKFSYRSSDMQLSVPLPTSLGCQHELANVNDLCNQLQIDATIPEFLMGTHPVQFTNRRYRKPLNALDIMPVNVRKGRRWKWTGEGQTGKLGEERTKGGGDTWL